MRPMRLAAALVSVMIVAPSCGGGNAASRLAVAPDYQPKDQSKCGVEKSQAKPLIVEWPSADRGELEAQAHNRGVVVVRYEGCDMQVLDGCTTTLKYAYSPITRKKDRVVMHDSDDLYANVPVGAARLEAKLEKSGELDVDMTLVGRWEAERRGVRFDELQGSCDGATHVVSAITVGSFTFTAGADATAGAGATVLGSGGGANSTSQRETLNADGDEAACAKATLDDKVPPAECGALLRVEVVPLAGAATAPTADRNAIVDMSGALVACRDGIAEKAALKQLFDARQQDLNVRQAALKKSKDDLDAHGASLPPDEYQRRLKQWQDSANELQQIFTRYNDELKDRQKKDTDPIFERLKRVAAALAAARGISVVYDKGAVVGGHPANDDIAYARAGVDGATDAERAKPRIDLTAEAIQAMDSGSR
jgi:Skp family chaperone for outer membrane proteins